MPMYSYQCNCGVRFDSSAPAAKHKDPKLCPDCGKPAARMMPTDVSGTFNQAVSGPVPQNTGISALDAHIDRVIGQSAKQGWEEMDKIRAEKRRTLRQNPGAKTEDLSRNLDGSYRVKPKDEKAFHERAVKINDLANKTLRPKPA